MRRLTASRSSRPFSSGLQVFEDAVGALEVLREMEIPTAVVSASPRSRLDLTLEAAGLEFAVSVAGDEVAGNKPQPDGYLAAALGMGIAAERCAAVEDTPNGVSAAVAAGMSVFAVDRVGEGPELLQRAGAVVLESVTVKALLA